MIRFAIEILSLRFVQCSHVKSFISPLATIESDSLSVYFFLVRYFCVVPSQSISHLNFNWKIGNFQPNFLRTDFCDGEKKASESNEREREKKKPKWRVIFRQFEKCGMARCQVVVCFSCAHNVPHTKHIIYLSAFLNPSGLRIFASDDQVNKRYQHNHRWLYTATRLKRLQ